MSISALRARAVLWGSITLVALVVPWSGAYARPGRLADVAVAGAVAVGLGALLVAEVRRRGWVRRHPLAELAVHWPLLAVGACGEEVLFRGVLLQLTASAWGPWAGILVSSAAFGLAHLPRGRARDARIHVLTGLILGVLAWLTGGWLAGAAVHIVYNCVVSEWVPAAPRSDRSDAAASDGSTDVDRTWNLRRYDPRSERPEVLIPGEAGQMSCRGEKR